MSSTQRRARRVKKLALPFALGLLLAFVPLPNVSFLSAPVLDRLPLPVVSDVGAQELSEQQAAADELLGTDRVSGVQDDVAAFSTIGILFDDAPTEPVMMRTQAADGSWDDWREVGVESDEGPDADTSEAAAAPASYGTEPIWVDEAVGYELSVGAGDADGAEVALVRDELQRTVTEATPLAGAALPRPFDIHLRSEWGARASSTSNASTVKLAVVHHSASSNSYSPADVPGVLRSIQAFHMDGRGWSDIAYNFVVDKYGGIWEGRGGGIDNPVIGAHAMGFNTTSVGVMVIGDYIAATPTGAALESVSQVIGWKLAMHNVDPAGQVDFVSGGSTSIPAGQTVSLPRVVGHQDVGQTGCPGSIRGSLGFIRARAQDWTNYLRAASTPVGAVDALDVGPGNVTASGWAADPDATGPVEVRLAIAGLTAVATTGLSRPDVPSAIPWAGPNAGYRVIAAGVPPGYQELCVVAMNQNLGTSDFPMSCRAVVVPDPAGTAVTGSIDQASATVGRVEIIGHVHGPGATGASAVGIEVDGVFQGWGGPIGNNFAMQVVGLAAGRHRVCAIGVSTASGSHTRFDCRNLDVPGARAIGAVDEIAGGPAIDVSGWALDLETVLPIPIAVVVDGRPVPLVANASRPDVAALYPGYGDAHGFSASIPAAPGRHDVCVQFGGVGAGSNWTPACASVVVK